jgi:monofunctional biosynthetic peptidoglycan transglycosylase
MGGVREGAVYAKKSALWEVPRETRVQGAPILYASPSVLSADPSMIDIASPSDEPDVTPARRRPLLRRVLVLLLALALAPFGLTLLFAVVPPISMPMIGRALLLQEVDRQWVALDDMAPVLPEAVLSSEDARFCLHHGVDFEAIKLVLEQGGEAGPKRGASTIAMQVAKNLYLWPLPALLRKPLEVPLALWIDLVWSKRRVIEVYLNIAEWGDGLFGAEAAARSYFDKPASALTRREAALLAVALPNPIKRDAGDPTRRLRILAGRIVGRSRASGDLFDCIK